MGRGMSAPATDYQAVGPYRLSFEFTDRKKLSDSDLKIPTQVAYLNCWVLRKDDGHGRWRFVRAFLEEAAARAWAAENS